jgi:hypothetical protein
MKTSIAEVTEGASEVAEAAVITHHSGTQNVTVLLLPVALTHLIYSPHSIISLIRHSCRFLHSSPFFLFPRHMLANF